MNKKSFVKKVINMTDKILSKHESLVDSDWVLYEDKLKVEIEDIRHKERRKTPEFSQDIREYFEDKDVKGAAKAVIRRIEDYDRDHDGYLYVENDEYDEEEEDYEYDEEEEDYEYDEEEEEEEYEEDEFEYDYENDDRY